MALDTLKNWQGQKFQGKIYVVFHVNYVVLSRFSVNVIGPSESDKMVKMFVCLVEKSSVASK